MSRLVLVSNRVADLDSAAQAGGLAVVIADTLREHPGLWFGWSGEIVDGVDLTQEKPRLDGQCGGNTVATIPLSSAEHDDYYLGYSNSVLWPVFHNRLDLARFDADFYPRYLEVNERFAQSLAPLLRPDDTIWIHDYHLIPMALALRRRGIENPIGFFLHIPVPPAQTFLAIPEHRELAHALSAYDLIGLQTRADVANLIKFLELAAGGRILPDGRIRSFERELRIESFPVSINFDDFRDPEPETLSVQTAGGAKRIIGVDRLDYTKGLPQKLSAYQRFLEKYPEYQGKVVLTQIAPPTRESVEAYSEIRSQLEGLAGKINGMFGELDWVPIHYIHRSAPRTRLRHIYRASRIGLFTPLRDGMNLVAKEYIASQDADDPGVVILSRFAGAAEQLTDALMVNPYDVEQVADTIRTALEMPLDERVARQKALFNVIKTHDTFAWSRAFLRALEASVRQRRGEHHQPSATISAALDKLDKAILTPMLGASRLSDPYSRPVGGAC